MPKTQIKLIKTQQHHQSPQQCACQAALCTELTLGGPVPARMADWLAGWPPFLSGRDPKQDALIRRERSRGPRLYRRTPVRKTSI